jgi:hypothetical protein
MIVGVLIVGGAVAYKMTQKPPPAEAPVPAPVLNAAPVQNTPIVQTVPHEENPAPVAPVAPKPVTQPTAPVTHAQPAFADPGQLVTDLVALDPKGPLSAEDVQKWKDNLHNLMRQGAAAIPSIVNYLAQNQDVFYTGVPGADDLGYPSLRSALLNALGSVGGQQATDAMLQTLQTSPYPADIATLAGLLQQQAPGQYDGQVLTAVRSQLSLAAQDQLGGANVGPLFQILANAAANGTDVSADLAQYDTKWPYYSTIGLANLPNGEGIATLIQMAQDSTGPSQTVAAATEALAELAAQNPQAQNALIDMAKQGQLTDAQLAELAPYLAGRQNELSGQTNPQGTTTQGLHIASGNQDFSVADTGTSLTPDQINQRLSTINQLIQALPSNDTMAQDQLNQIKGALTGRLPPK